MNYSDSPSYDYETVLVFPLKIEATICVTTLHFEESFSLLFKVKYATFNAGNRKVQPPF